jgi:hypothetical protein
MLLSTLIMIALLVSALIASQMESNIDVRYGQSKVYWSSSSPFSVLEAKALRNGVSLVLKNSGPRQIYLKSIEVKDKLALAPNVTTYTAPIQFISGEKRKLSVPVTYIQSGRFCQLTLHFAYRDSELEKEQPGLEDLIVPCHFSCSETDEYCELSSDCCEGYCLNNECACREIGFSCSNSSQCCNANCGPYMGGDACCQPENASCSSDSDCCSPLGCGAGQCKQMLPDLVITDATVSNPDGSAPPAYYDGMDYNITYSIMNIGPADAAGPIQHESTDSPSCGTPATTLVNSGGINSSQTVLIGGYQFTCFANSTCNQTLRAQSAMADSNLSANEISETNNNYSFEVQCQCRPGGMICGTDAQCCSGDCDAGICTEYIPPCADLGDNCTLLPCCSSYFCDPAIGNICISCIPEGGNCQYNNTGCCSDSYCNVLGVPPLCAPCRQYGQACDEYSPCCANLICNAGICSGADLIAFSPAMPAMMQVNIPYSFNVTTENQGNMNAMNESITRVIWNGSAVSNLTVSALSPSGSNTQQIPFTCPAPGPWTVSLVADARNNVSEANETNNVHNYTITCYCGTCSLQGNAVSLGSGAPPWKPYLSYDFDISTAANTSIAAIWLTGVHLDDYGQIYLNGLWALNDSAPGPFTQGLGTGSRCNNFNLTGPYYINPALINMGYGAANNFHIDNVDYCWGSVSVDLILNYNISMLPQSNTSCACPSNSTGLVTVSPLYHNPSLACTASTELSTTECLVAGSERGICSWNWDGLECITCKIFPANCTSNSECCNNLCENYNGTMRCAYSPHKSCNSASSCGNCNLTTYLNVSGICAPRCGIGYPTCPSPLVCTGSEPKRNCRFPCTAAPQCGTFTTRCTSGYCKYSTTVSYG